MANYNYNVDVDYNVKASSAQGGGLLTPDSTYEFVDALPTGSNIRQDRFYKVNGNNGLYWWNGTDWTNLTDTVIKAGITEVPALPTTSIKSDIFYHVTGTSEIEWYDPVNTEWVGIATNHVIQVDDITSVTSPSHIILYQVKDTNKLYFYDYDSKWRDIAYDNGIQIVTALPTADIVSDKLYFLSTTGILYWHDGTNWIDISTNFGVVKVTTKPTVGMRQDCFYYSDDDTDAIWWYNGSSWFNLAEAAGIIIWDKTYPPYEMTDTPSDRVLYNWLSDDSLWWYNSHGSAWVDVAKDTAIRIVTALSSAEKRQDLLYKPLYETAIYWWNGTEWYDIYKNHGVVEVASYPASGQRTDCLYKLVNDTDLMWWDGNQWVDISTDNGIIKATSLPDITNAKHTNLYWVTDATNNNKLYWLNYSNEWIDLGSGATIKNVGVLPLTPDTTKLYRLSTDSHLYYYTSEWVDITDNHGVVTVTDLPNSLNAKMDRIYKKASENKLYWWNGNQWKIISDNGGMVEVTSLPTTPSDTSVLYRLTDYQYDPTTGELLYSPYVYAWINSKWVMMKGSEILPDRGLSLVDGKIGHSNAAITADTTNVVHPVALKYDIYGHITGATKLSNTYDMSLSSTNGLIMQYVNESDNYYQYMLLPARDLNITMDSVIGTGTADDPYWITGRIGHSNNTITAVTGFTNNILHNLKYDTYGHITGVRNINVGNGITITATTSGKSTTYTLGHVETVTPGTDEVVYKVKYDKYGHAASVTALTEDTWTFTKTDGTTVTKKVWVSS